MPAKMSETLKIAYTSLFTILGGVVVFAISEAVQNFIFRPWQEYRKKIGEIDNELKFYANIIANPPANIEEYNDGKYRECSSVLRRLSCDLEAMRKQLVFKTKNQDKRVADAARRLIGLSNSLGWIAGHIRGDFNDCVEIRKSLKIPELA
jgi:hypothetical protein